MNFIYENQKLFGFSQQVFDKHIKKVMFEDINSTFLANDHLAIVKAEGSCKEHEANIPSQPEGVTEHEETLFSLSKFTNFAVEVKQFVSRIFAMFTWFNPLGQGELMKQMHLKEQIPLLKEMSYSQESEEPWRPTTRRDEHILGEY